MNPEIKAKWVAALRSGEYQQGRERLRAANDKFCCLGVLCDIHSKETGTPWQYGDIDRNVYCGKTAFLPESVADWAELTHVGPYIQSIGSLTNLNDGGSTFPQIADLIEKHL